jgi:DNA topoisomerase IA
LVLEPRFEFISNKFSLESEFKINGSGERTQIRNSSPPFTTSTLQQEASRKLGFSIQRTMSVAQHLYEAGHITYMRTDSINLSAEAIKSIGDYIKSIYELIPSIQNIPRSQINKTPNIHDEYDLKTIIIILFKLLIL